MANPRSRPNWQKILLLSEYQAQNGVILDYLPKMAKNVLNILLSDQIGMIINGWAEGSSS
jgi:hypothetical protein